MTNFTYSEADKSLSYTLDKGRHNLSFVLVDEAGNSYTVQEVSFIQVGLFYCLWFRILLGFIIAALVGVSIWLFKKKNHTLNCRTPTKHQNQAPHPLVLSKRV